MPDEVTEAEPHSWHWSSGTRRSRRAWVVVALLCADTLAVFLAGVVATLSRFGTLGAVVGFENTDLTIEFWQVALVVVPLWIAFLALSRLYDVDSVSWGLSVAGRVARALSMGVVALILVTYVAKVPGLSRAWTLLFWGLSIVFVLVLRGAIALFVAWARTTGRLLQPTLRGRRHHQGVAQRPDGRFGPDGLLGFLPSRPAHAGLLF